LLKLPKLSSQIEV